MFPKLIGFPLTGLFIVTEDPMLEQVSSPPRFWYSELDRAWAPATKATKGKNTRMVVSFEGGVRQRYRT